MNAALSPIVSEFETEEHAASYGRWLRAKVQAGRNDGRPGIPHDEAMVRIREKLANKLASQEEALTKSQSRDQ